MPSSLTNGKALDTQRVKSPVSPSWARRWVTRAGSKEKRREKEEREHDLRKEVRTKDRSPVVATKREWRCAKGRDNRGNFEIFCDQNITKTNYLFFENGDKEDDFKL